MENYGQYGVQCVFTQQQTEKRQSNYQEAGQEPGKDHQRHEGGVPWGTVHVQTRRRCRRIQREIGQAQKVYIPEQKQLWAGQEA